jgi:hypothetical protein
MFNIKIPFFINLNNLFNKSSKLAFDTFSTIANPDSFIIREKLAQSI